MSTGSLTVNEYDPLHELTEQRLATLLGPYLERSQIAAVMARRDVIVEHFRRRIEESGEENVFYDLAGPVSSQLDPSPFHHGLLAGCCRTPRGILSDLLERSAIGRRAA